MEFIRRWLVNRDLKRGRALEGEGYADQALAAAAHAARSRTLPEPATRPQHGLASGTASLVGQ